MKTKGVSRCGGPAVRAALLILTVLVAAAGPCRAGNVTSFSDEEQRFLLDLARKAIVRFLDDGEILKVEEAKVPERLRAKRGCFVTLHKGPEMMLRGCIGSLIAQEPLYTDVIMNAIRAATRDPRFPRVTAAEMDDITLEISVLTVPHALACTPGRDLAKKLRPNTDGVILTYRYCRATYLPQVWEQIPDPEDFLSHLCRKGGCPADCWRREGVAIETYQAEYFSEHKGQGEAEPTETNGEQHP